MRTKPNVIELIEIEKGVWGPKRKQHSQLDYFGIKPMFFILAGYAVLRIFEAFYR